MRAVKITIYHLKRNTFQLWYLKTLSLLSLPKLFRNFDDDLYGISCFKNPIKIYHFKKKKKRFLIDFLQGISLKIKVENYIFVLFRNNSMK